jgi:hypothetical protein
MKLIIKRDQDKGFFGGMSFILRAQVVLTAEEQALVNRYKAHKEVLFTRKDGERKYMVNDLVTGMEDKVKDVTILLENEQIYKNVCEKFKSLLVVMATFGGEQVIEY